MTGSFNMIEELKNILSKPEMFNIVYFYGVTPEILSKIEFFISSQKMSFLSINSEKVRDINLNDVWIPKIILLFDIEYFVRNPSEEGFLITLIEKCMKEKKQLLIAAKYPLEELKFSENILSYLRNIVKFKVGDYIKQDNQFSEIIKSIESEIPELKTERNIVEELREEYKAKMYIWKMKGFNTARIENVIDGSIEEITSEFISFTSDIQRLIELQKRYGILEQNLIPENEKAEIEKKLFDPDSIYELEYKISFYEKRSTLRNQFKLVLSWGEDFNNIESDESNEELIKFLMEFSSEPYKYKGLNLIKGEKGFGKSTYLNATGIRLFENFKGIVVAYITPHLMLNIDDFIDSLSYWDMAIIDDIDKVLFRYQKIFNEDVLNIIFDMPVLASFTSSGFVDMIKQFTINTLFEIKEPGLKIKRRMLEKITIDKDLIEKAEKLLNEVKGGYYELENLLSELYFRKKEETKEEAKLEMKIEETETKPTVNEIETEEVIIEDKIKEEIVETKKEDIKKIEFIKDGIALNIENENLRIQKEI